MSDSNPCFKLLSNYFIEGSQNSQYINESTDVTGRSDTDMRSVKVMMRLGFPRQKKLSSHVELVLYCQPFVGNILTLSHLDPELCFEAVLLTGVIHGGNPAQVL